MAYLPSTSRGDDFCLLSGNRSAYDARLELIDLARHEIAIAYYAIDSGYVALTLLSRLRDAANRGVKVRILVDGLKSRLPADFENLLVQDGVELRVYHPPTLKHPLWLNRRIHYKLFVVDSQAMIVGSRNLEDSHFGLAESNFLDRDFLMTGDICRQAADHFLTLWDSKEVLEVNESYSFGLNIRDNIEMKVPRAVLASVVQGTASTAAKSQSSAEQSLRPLLEKRLEVYERRLTDASQRLASRTDFVDCERCCSVDPCVENVVCSILVHDQGQDKSARRFQAQVIAIMDSAKHSLWIESPYPVLERPVKDALTRAAERGIKIALLTNSLGSTDRTGPYAAYQNDKREFQRLGIELLEYIGSDTLHSKSILVDDQSVLLGSYNMDVRSDRLNLEFGVWIQDNRVCEVIKHEVQQRMANSQAVQRAQFGSPEVIRGDATLVKYSQMRFRQLFIPLLRNQL